MVSGSSFSFDGIRCNPFWWTAIIPPLAMVVLDKYKEVRTISLVKRKLSKLPGVLLQPYQ